MVRLDRGLLQRDVASELRLDIDTLHKWETNRTAPSIRLVPRILTFLGYDPSLTPHSFPETLIVFRRTHGLARRRLAKTLGIDESTLARWETRKSRPNRKSMSLIQSNLGRLP